MAQEQKKQIKDGYLSQNVGIDNKKLFNKLSNDLSNFAIANGHNEPNKGDILSRLIKEGAKMFTKDPGSFFKSV